MWFNLTTETLIKLLLDRDRTIAELQSINSKLLGVTCKLEILEKITMATQEQVDQLQTDLNEVSAAFAAHNESVMGTLNNIDVKLDEIATRIQSLIDSNSGSGPDLSPLLDQLAALKSEISTKSAEIQSKADAVLAEADTLDGSD